jgi:predicted nucleotidyltransferase
MPPPKARLTRRTILTTLRRSRGLLNKYAVRRIGLFGSFASGRPTEGSDIDLVVEFERPTYDNYMGLSRELEKLFGKRVDILTPEGLHSIRVRSVSDSIRKSLAYV